MNPSSAPSAVGISPAELLARWDAQQTGYIRHRAGRFDAMIQAIELLGPVEPRVLDLACGPGSLTRLIRTRLPGSWVVAVDKDPLLLAIARDVFAADEQVRVVRGDLDDPAWVDAAGGPFDAVVSATALHWLRPEVLSRVYFELAGLVSAGGLFLNADHLRYDPRSQPTFRRIAEADDAAQQRDALGSGADTWDAWWELASSRPEYAAEVAERAKVWPDQQDPAAVTLGYHQEALRSAGFSEVGTIWQYLDDLVVAAVR